MGLAQIDCNVYASFPDATQIHVGGKVLAGEEDLHHKKLRGKTWAGESQSYNNIIVMCDRTMLIRRIQK